MKKLILFFFLCECVIAHAMEKQNYTKLELQETINLGDGYHASCRYNRGNKDLSLIFEHKEQATVEWLVLLRNKIETEYLHSVTIKGLVQWGTSILALLIASKDTTNHLIDIIELEANHGSMVKYDQLGGFVGKILDVGVAEDSAHNLAITVFLKCGHEIHKYRYLIAQDFSKKITANSLVSRYLKEQSKH